MDISLQCVAVSGEPGESLSLAELWIFGMPGSEEGKCVALTRTAPNKWEVAGAIEVPYEVDGIDCIAKDNDDDDIGFLHLDCKEMRVAGTRPGHRATQKLEHWNGPCGSLTMSWEVSPKKSMVVVVALHERGLELLALFDAAAELKYLNISIAMLQKAVEWIPTHHPSLLSWLDDLARAFHHHFKRTGEPKDIAGAISALKKAVRLTPKDHHDKLLNLYRNLATACTSIYKRTSNLTDLCDAVLAFQKVNELTPHGEADLPINVLWNLPFERFERTGSVSSDISQAIFALQKAVDLTPLTHSSRSTLLENLGILYLHRFERYGSLPDVAEAISVLHKAVQATPEGDTDLPERLNHLGALYVRRFEHTVSLPDVAEAISVFRRALEYTQEGYPVLPGLLGNLASALILRYGQGGDPTDVSEAIAAQRRAVAITLPDDPSLPAQFSNLSTFLRRRYDHSGAIPDVDDAILTMRKAIKLTPDGQASLPVRLSNLGRSLGTRFRHTKDVSDISEAVAVMQRAMRLTPDGHASLSRRLIDLAICFEDWSSEAGCSEHLAMAISHYRSAANSPSSPPRVRLEAAENWGRAVKRYDSGSTQVIDAFDVAISLIALIAGLEQTVEARYEQLQNVSGIALEAAAAACKLGRLDKAVEWLEQGRCLVWSQLNHLRTPLDDLRHHDPQLAQKVTDISTQLASASSNRGTLDDGMSMSEKASVEDEARSQLRLAREWDGVLANVRSIPGFESFLRPAPCSSLLRHLPLCGPIVVINLAGEQCDAIALLAELEEPIHIPLPGFSFSKANQYRSQLNAHVRSHGLRVREGQAAENKLPGRSLRPYRREGKERRGALSVLRSLWVEVVKPILDALGYSRSDMTGQKQPRIWWCPTGPLSFLPLHAAGIYEGRVVETILDYAASSYTPSVTALTDRAKRSRSLDGTASGLFLTSQPRAPGTPFIPGTTAEVDGVYAMAREKGVRSLKLEGDSLTVDECLNNMDEYSCIHFACHALQNAENPLQSRFIFHNGSLDLNAVLQRKVKNADLAFLSACQTSTGEEKLSDEAVHLAAGMLAAGYRSVVATMWSIGDAHAPAVARDFYKSLWMSVDDGQDRACGWSDPAYSLHSSIQALRHRIGDSEESILAWVPYVHFGY